MFTQNFDARQASINELFKTYVCEHSGSAGTIKMFTHEDSKNRRFVAVGVSTQVVTNSTSATFSLGVIPSAYTDIVASAGLGVTGGFYVKNTIIQSTASTRVSLAPGTAAYCVTSGACHFRLYVQGFLV